MRVSELIEKLQGCDPDAVVIYDGGDVDMMVRYVQDGMGFTRKEPWDYGTVSLVDGEPCVYLE